MEKVYVEIKLPVNPSGFSFVRKVYGLLKQYGIDLKEEQYKWIQRELQRLGYNISDFLEKNGYEQLFSGTIEIDLENKTVRVTKYEVYKKEVISPT